MLTSKFIYAYIFFAIASASGCGIPDGLPASSSQQAVAAESKSEDPKAGQIQIEIDKYPGNTSGYTALAAHYIKKARETGDFSINRKAQEAVNAALKIDPANLNARKLQLSLEATFHRFTEAIEIGRQMQLEHPSDPFALGVLTDAYIETGNYVEAVAAAQKMVDLRPNSASYSRVSLLRSLHGDHKGAVELMTLAAKTADPADKEAQSWCLVHLGKEYFKVGDLGRAEKIYDEALAISPGYTLGLLEKSRVLAARGDFDGALNAIPEGGKVPLTPQAYQFRGEIETKRGNTAAAEAAFQKAEEAARGLDGDMHPFALWWSDRGVRLDEALKIATTDFGSNTDIHGADFLAWSMYKNGRFDEAKSAIKIALRLNTNDARILYHAGMIEKALGNKRGAEKYLESALKANPSFDLIQNDIARNTLAGLKG